jgi:subtilisin family serine protease
VRDKLFAPLDAGLMFTADESLSSHATNVCSIIAGESAQMTGAAPDVRLVPVVVNLRSQVYAERADAIRKVAQIAREGLGGNRCARVVCSCSWRTSGDIAVMRSAIEEAIAADVFMVFSAGNENSDAPHFPSDYGTSGAAADGIVGVAATTQDDTKASYSSFSRNVSLAAPGGDGLPLDERDIVCADQGGTYVAAAGTSIAAPHVAAVAALMLSVRPDLSLGALKRALLESCDSIDLANPAYRGKLGAGRVNAERAVEAVLAPEDAMNGERMAPETIVPPLLGFRLGSPAVATPVDETAGGFIPELGGELELGSGWRVAALVLTKAGDVRVVAPSGGAR